MAVFLRISADKEALDFYDTDDISTIRGGSMWMEDIAACAKAALGGEMLDHGASRVLLKFEADTGLADKVAKFLATDPWRHFRFIWGIGTTGEEARKEAEAASSGWSFAPCIPMEGKNGPDPLDRLRPATETEIGPDGEGRLLSPSTFIRRKKGRTSRPHLFAGDDRVPPQSFAEIVADPPDHVAQVVRGKLAVVVADGVKIGALRRALAGGRPDGISDEAAQREFADAMDGLRQRLARRIEAWAEASGLIYRRYVPYLKAERTSARVDVLVWGGDDMTFVLPASHVFPFLEIFFDEVGKPFVEGRVEAGLPHRVGVSIAQVKTPIRQMRAMATEAQDRVRGWLGDRKQSAFAIDVFESSPLAFSGVEGFRKAQYGQGFAAEATTFVAGDLARLKAFFAGGGIAAGTGAAVSTSQVHRVLQRLRTHRHALSSAVAGESARALLDQHVAAQRGGTAPADAWLDAFSENRRHLPVMLAECAQLEPYVRAGWTECRPTDAGKAPKAVVEEAR